MNRCPDIDDLMGTPSAPSLVAEHVETCEACRAITALSHLRHGNAPPAASEEECARFEPALASLVDGTIDRLEIGALVEHLAACSTCNELAASLSALDLADVPEPAGLARGLRALPAGPAPARGLRPLRSRWSLPPPAGPAPAREANRPGLLRGLVAPTARWLWGAELLVAAGLTLWIGVWWGGLAPASNNAIVAVADLEIRETNANEDTPPLAGSAANRGTPTFPVVATPPGDEGSSRPGASQPSSRTAPPPNNKGYLSVACAPMCDAVVVDGRRVGPSPVVKHAVSPGRHTLRLERGKLKKHVAVVVKSGKVARVSVRMAGDKPDTGSSGKPGTLSINCNPFCESVELDGKKLGPSPIVKRRVRSGRHEVTLRRGTLTKRVSVHVEPGGTGAVRVSMDSDKTDGKASGKPGTVSIVCNPFCESVELDGKKLGSSPIVKRRVSPGRHELTLRKGSLTKRASIHVEPGGAATVRISMEE